MEEITEVFIDGRFTPSSHAAAIHVLPEFTALKNGYMWPGYLYGKYRINTAKWLSVAPLGDVSAITECSKIKPTLPSLDSSGRTCGEKEKSQVE